MPVMLRSTVACHGGVQHLSSVQHNNELVLCCLCLLCYQYLDRLFLMLQERLHMNSETPSVKLTKQY